ncbi:hypothetical protein SAMN06297280_3383 [Arsukibacterium tuosuense]|uniref:Uncharacterized protein n=1 Tax=Arsukibacterium tuosuense TaxID=1323745 RepID=A0A285JGV9_9GAMM|nr:hypothetical protein [Arsukibacterium tuosuense]SNY58381.1 hypothetical protein SAMN06297280_3383 [Arsukibacterium tuosuense]
MTLIVSGSARDLTEMINNFSSKYHDDFFYTNSLAKDYLSTTPSMTKATALAKALNTTLNNWGAGKRSAPTAQSIEVIARALLLPALHSNLIELAKSSFYLTIDNGHRALREGSPFTSISSFDQCLMSTLGDLSSMFLIDNTNVTYPMKLLLLITGLMPALDSQVKGGLAISGVPGINKTRYLLPEDMNVDAKKICCLPFYINDCASRHLELIASAISDSLYPSLSNEYGRIFDILFFMQKTLTSSNRVIFFENQARGQKWYNI